MMTFNAIRDDLDKKGCCLTKGSLEDALKMKEKIPGVEAYLTRERNILFVSERLYGDARTEILNKYRCTKVIETADEAGTNPMATENCHQSDDGYLVLGIIICNHEAEPEDQPPEFPSYEIQGPLPFERIEEVRNALYRGLTPPAGYTITVTTTGQRTKLYLAKE